MLPRHIHALVSALSFRNSRPELLRTLDDAEWEQLLVFGDQMHLTIPLAQSCDSYLPARVLSRIDRNIADNARRFQMIKDTYSEIADALKNAHADFLVLKGFTKSPDYAPDPRHRIQSDVDIFCPGESILRARDALAALGYRSQHGFDAMSWDHLPSLHKQTGWKWRGNAYDPEMPLSVELHHSFWDRAALRCGPDALNDFWQRRVERHLEEIAFSSLSPVDNFGYLALNLVRDLMRGAAIVTSQVYELAWFLHHNANNEEFWNRWTGLHNDELRSLESISFLLAESWFHCDLPEAGEAEIARLPIATRRWFELQATRPSPMGWLRPTKDGVWLHSSLLQSTKTKREVILERLLPTRYLPMDAAIVNHTPNISPAEQSISQNYKHYFVYLVGRLTYNMWVLPNTLWHGFRWWWSARI